jgi:hypothetical protein
MLSLYIILLLFDLGAIFGALVGAIIGRGVGGGVGGLIMEQTRKSNKGNNVVSKLYFQHGTITKFAQFITYRVGRGVGVGVGGPIKQERKQGNVVSKLCFQQRTKFAYFSLTGLVGVWVAASEA